LALVARRGDRLRELAAEIAVEGHPEPVVLAADLGEAGRATEVAAQAEECLGPIDVLVNNAGASIQGLSWVAGDCAEARGVLETNFWSPLALTAAVAPSMVDRGEGVIVNTGSMVQVPRSRISAITRRRARHSRSSPRSCSSSSGLAG
jgi:short-subunit dehydrogenase